MTKRRDAELVRGPKVARCRSHVIPAAEPIVLAAKTVPAVTKVVLGDVITLGAGKRRMKVLQLPGMLKTAVRGGASQQTLYIYTSDGVATERAIEQAWIAHKT